VHKYRIAYDKLLLTACFLQRNKLRGP